MVLKNASCQLCPAAGVSVHRHQSPALPAVPSGCVRYCFPSQICVRFPGYGRIIAVSGRITLSQSQRQCVGWLEPVFLKAAQVKARPDNPEPVNAGISPGIR